MKKVILIIIILLSYNAGYSQFSLDMETGMVFSGYNNVRIPGDTGTRFSLSEDLDANSALFFRARINYSINQKQTLSLLIAPLTITSEGQIPKDVNFEGTVFPAQEKIEATFRFNSYRLTWRYRILHKENFSLGLGISGKIRDAEIKLKSSNNESSKTNVGFVPLINFRCLWQFQKNFGLIFMGDALASPQGRAEDILVALKGDISDKISLKFGYRILEGGADVDEVYNFTLIHYAVAGVIVSI
ncbi:MAG: hypothetical protein R6V04_14200 [bacterium]